MIFHISSILKNKIIFIVNKKYYIINIININIPLELLFYNEFQIVYEIQLNGLLANERFLSNHQIISLH